jgi:hypothetical protein
MSERSATPEAPQLKVIRQIVEHLDRQGVLTPQQKGYLLRAGFLARKSEPFEHEAAPGEEVEDLLEQEWALRAAARAVAERRRSGGGQRRPAPLELRELLAWLEERAAAWLEPLGAMVRLARQASAEAGLREMPRVLLEAKDEDLEEALARGLRSRDPSLGALWAALEFDGYGERLEAPDARGRIAAAYRALLTGAGVAELGRHGWLLREPRARWIYHLVRARRRTLCACWRLQAQRPRVVAGVLRSGSPEPAYWTFVLLYNACRSGPEGPAVKAWPRFDERRPRRDVPEAGTWERAWAMALLAEPRRVLPFLLEACGRHPKPAEAGDLRLLCPAAWDW